MANNDAEWSDWEEEINELLQRPESENDNGKTAKKGENELPSRPPSASQPLTPQPQEQCRLSQPVSPSLPPSPGQHQMSPSPQPSSSMELPCSQLESATLSSLQQLSFPVSSPPSSSIPSPSSPLQTPVHCQSPAPTNPSAVSTSLFTTPPEKTPPRKRKANPTKWKKNVRKQLRLEGKEYISSQGKPVQGKKVRPVNCSCKLQCSSKVTDTQRQAIFDMFYGLGSAEKQRDFVCGHVEQKGTLTYLDHNKEPVMKTRQIARKYFLFADESKVQVCKRFFQSTLDIGHGFIDTTMKNAENGKYVGQEKRGKHVPSNKTSEESKARVRRHIESLTAVESHSCRQRSKRKFLNSTLNVNVMYGFYCDLCEADGVKPVSSSLYRDIFNTEYNLDFLKPKKDLSFVCSVYLEDKPCGELKAERETEYQEHIQRKHEAREEKAKDKELSKQSDDVHCVTLDLGAVFKCKSSAL